MSIRPTDIRILANPADGHTYYTTAFHELGHAMHAAHANPGSYILRREPAVFSEGMAEMLGYTVQHPAWLAHLGLSPIDVGAAATGEGRGSWFDYLRQRSAHPSSSTPLTPTPTASWTPSTRRLRRGCWGAV